MATDEGGDGEGAGAGSDDVAGPESDDAAAPGNGGRADAGAGADESGNAASGTTRPGEPQRVLVPVDGSPQARTAMEYALVEFPDAVLHFLNVIDPIDAGYATGPAPPGEGHEWYENRKAAAESLFAEAGALADEAGVAYETSIELGRPAKCIISCAEEREVDHVVMGSHGRSGVSRILLGSVAETVVRRSPVPVTIVR